jgi:seryl-tRNA synthetase
MIPGEDLSFMPRQTGEKRKNYDEELVKYSTERSEEIPWGDNNRDNRDTRDKWENNRDNRDKWENKDKWDNKDKWENRDRERSR